MTLEGRSGLPKTVGTQTQFAILDEATLPDQRGQPHAGSYFANSLRSIESDIIL